MADQTSTRLHSADLLKGLLIIGVVFAHLVFFRFDVQTDKVTGTVFVDTIIPNGPDWGSLTLMFLYLGLMSFFIISGYFYRPGRGFKANMKKRVLQLLIAIVISTLAIPPILYVWLAVCGQCPPLDNILLAYQWGFGLNGVFGPYSGFTEHPICAGFVGYYFIWTMLWGFVIFYALADRVIDEWWKALTTIVVLLVASLLIFMYIPIRLPMFMNASPLAAAFMLAGACLAKVHLLEWIESIRWKDWRYWGLFMGSLVLGALLIYLFPQGTEWDSRSVFTPILLIQGILVFIALYFVAKIFTAIPVFSGLIEETGKHTLGILLLHGSVAKFLIAPFFVFGNGSWFPDGVGAYEGSIVALLTIVICVLICRYGPILVRSLKARRSNASTQ